MILIYGLVFGPTSDYSVFFYKNPPPPEISPLPLHAALPISRSAWRGRITALNRQFRIVTTSLLGYGGTTECRTAADFSIEREPKLSRQSESRAINPSLTDRKSTRLNSSHLVNSYAILCLKKKRKSNRRISPCGSTSTSRMRTARRRLRHSQCVPRMPSRLEAGHARRCRLATKCRLTALGP